jgi:2-methylisocitrate lyase-like PEP mutase family enzyme
MLRARLGRAERVLVAPGVHDPLTARLVEAAGFEVAYVGGAAFSYGQLAMPDLGLAGLDEMREHVRRVHEATRLPLIVDADCGFGDVLNVRRTVREYAFAGASALQIEDQTYPKRCGHLVGREVVDRHEAVVRVETALDSRPSADVAIIARTDSRTVLGLGEVIERARLFEAAGADAVFPESLESVDEYRAVRDAVSVPLVANMVEGGRSPDLTAAEIEAMGYQLALFPGSVTRAVAHAARELLLALRRDGTTRAVRERMLSFGELQSLLDYERWMDYVDGMKKGGAADAQRRG